MASSETVTEKLNRLRRQQNARLRSNEPNFIPSSSTSWPFAALAYMANPQGPSERGVPRTVRPSLPPPRTASRLAGPAAPKSWSTKFDPSSDLSTMPCHTLCGNSEDLWMSGVRMRVKSPLDPSTSRGDKSEEVEGMGDGVLPASLVEYCLRAVADDLDYGDRSLLLPYSHLLPRHLKLQLLRIASMWNPLRDQAVQALLGPQIPTGGREENGDGRDKEEADEEVDPLGSDDDEDDDLDLEAPMTHLDLSFSEITLRTLRTVLLKQKAGMPQGQGQGQGPGQQAPSLNPQFVLLTDLNLSCTPSLPLSAPLFTLLSRLPALKRLAIPHKILPSSSTLSSAVVLARLAVCTRSLEELDISYSREWVCRKGLENVDWGRLWLRLRRLAVVDCRALMLDLGSETISFLESGSPSTTDGAKHTREMAIACIRDTVKHRVQDLIKTSASQRPETRRTWVDVIV